MATIQRSNTKVANKLINYAEKRAEVREGVNCPAEYAKSQMKSTRELWGKTDGIQAHHVIQSFKPGEVTPEQANEIGQELAKEIAKGHEAVIYTHTDKDHTHNHIVINSVSYENGKKYHASKESLYQIREANDRLCKERGLSVVKEPYAKERSHMAEHGLAERGEMSWKQEIRSVIDQEKEHSTNFVEFKNRLQENYGIEVKERGKNITFTHPDNNRKVRGSTLGKDYEKETIKHELERKIERSKSSQERGTSRVPNEQHTENRGHQHARVTGEIEGNRELSVGASAGRNTKENSDRERIETDSRSQPETTKANDFDIHEFNKRLEERKRGIQAGYKQQYYRSDEGDRTAEQRYEKQQSKSERGIDKQQGNDREELERDRAKQQKHAERVAERDNDYDLER